MFPNYAHIIKYTNSTARMPAHTCIYLHTYAHCTHTTNMHVPVHVWTHAHLHTHALLLFVEQHPPQWWDRGLWVGTEAGWLRGCRKGPWCKMAV